MLLPKHAKGKGGGGWRSTTSARLPAYKTVVTYLNRSRLIYVVAVLGFLMLWRSISGRTAHGMDRFVAVHSPLSLSWPARDGSNSHA